jgi:hypothetical protein
MSPRPKQDPLPALPPDTKGAALAFHAWCVEELRRRRSRDAELDVDRFGRAASLVLRRLGTRGEGDPE